jgi:hypothetical protein
VDDFRSALMMNYDLQLPADVTTRKTTVTQDPEPVSDRVGSSQSCLTLKIYR